MIRTFVASFTKAPGHGRERAARSLPGAAWAQVFGSGRYASRFARIIRQWCHRSALLGCVGPSLAALSPQPRRIQFKGRPTDYRLGRSVQQPPGSQAAQARSAMLALKL